jgi:NAD(P)-dependent dehydrogenase (short-subunit alcohol dehydrogenase family)
MNNWQDIDSCFGTPPEALSRVRAEYPYHYGMTKTAQLAISQGIAESVAGTGVTANAVLPGPTRSEGAIEFLEKMARERGMDVKEAETEAVWVETKTRLGSTE